MYTTLPFLASLVAAAPASLSAGPKCVNDLSFPVNVTAPIVKLPSHFNSSTFNSSTVTDLPKENVTGCYNIAARFCEPSVTNQSRTDTLQLLVHGVTYNRDYWSALGPPSQGPEGQQYSWIDYASSQGYPTLSIDRLCNGASSKPNGLKQCQLEYQAATIVEVIKAAKAGKIADRKFKHVILVGHSAGSLLTNIISQKYPNEADAIILTGYTPYLFGLPGQKPSQPTPKVTPQKPDPTYLQLANETQFDYMFFYGGYSESLAHYNFVNEGTLTIGETITLAFGTLKAETYGGDVFVLTGENDALFCTQTSGPGNCGTGSSSASAAVQSLYPGARSFEYFQPANTGHCLNLHYSAQESYQAAHQFLASHNY